MAKPGFIAASPAQLHLWHAGGRSRLWLTRIRRSRAFPDATRQRHADGVTRGAAVTDLVNRVLTGAALVGWVSAAKPTTRPQPPEGCEGFRYRKTHPTAPASVVETAEPDRRGARKNAPFAPYPHVRNTFKSSDPS